MVLESVVVYFTGYRTVSGAKYRYPGVGVL